VRGGMLLGKLVGGEGERAGRRQRGGRGKGECRGREDGGVGRGGRVAEE